MRLLDWIKKIEEKPILRSQVRGLTVISLLGLAVFLFVFYSYGRLPNYFARKAMKDIGSGEVAVELEDDTAASGIYFVPSGIKVKDFLAQRGIVVEKETAPTAQIVRRGMKIKVIGRKEIIIGEMEAVKRLALDIPLNVNRASSEDLMLIPGVGEKTALAIVAFRQQRGGRIEAIEELLQIPGIKEKRLATLKEYLTCKED